MSDEILTHDALIDAPPLQPAAGARLARGGARLPVQPMPEDALALKIAVLRFIDVLNRPYEKFFIPDIRLRPTEAKLLDFVMASEEAVTRNEIRQKFFTHAESKDILNVYVCWMREALQPVGVFLKGENDLSVSVNHKRRLKRLAKGWYQDFAQFTAVMQSYGLPMEVNAGHLPDDVSVLQEMARTLLRLVQGDPDSLTVSEKLMLGPQQKAMANAFVVSSRGFVSFDRIDIVRQPFNLTPTEHDKKIRSGVFHELKTKLSEAGIACFTRNFVGAFMAKPDQRKLARLLGTVLPAGIT